MGECAYFHSVPSPIALNFTIHLLLQRLFSFYPFSNCAYLRLAHSPTALFSFHLKVISLTYPAPISVGRGSIPPTLIPALIPFHSHPSALIHCRSTYQSMTWGRGREGKGE